MAELDDGRPFTRRQLARAGGDPAVLRTVAFHQVMRDVWVRKAGIDRDTMTRAALCIHPESAFASHVSAAEAHGLPVPEPAFVHVMVRHEEDRRYRPEIKCHVTNRNLEPVVVRGMKVTNLVDTFISCAGMLSLVDLVILGDAMVRKYSITAKKLRRACARSSDYYSGLARTAAAYVRDGVDSPMETRLRMLIVLAGLPEPEVNVRLYNDDGTWRRRFDLCYRRIKLVVEYDGRQHAEDPTQWGRDLERREEFDDEGYRLLVVRAFGIFREPERTLERIHRQLVLRGWGEVPPINRTWRDHFAA
jgi:hypothetical protein